MKQNKMAPAELRAATALAGIFSLRMLGLFMILPVFMVYAGQLQGATPLLAGLAIGAYGLTQALLQIPFGMLSDRIGRKPVIAGGLLLFALGSVIAAMSTSIIWIIAGRAVQGSGAIAAAIMAFNADLTREQHRTKAMAIIGMSIGLAFMAAMVIGPIINGWIGVPGIFWVSAGLAVGGLAILFMAVPHHAEHHVHRDAELVPSQLSGILADTQLLRLDFGIMVLHMILMANFVAVPLALHQLAQVHIDSHWQVYLPVLLVSVAIMIPFIILAEKHHLLKQVFIGAVAVLVLAELALLAFHDTLVQIILSLVIFFSAFNLLEAMLPSLVSRVAPADRKGTALGVYSSSQFMGAFIGGASGGALYGAFGFTGVFTFTTILASLWLLAAITMKAPAYLNNYLLKVGRVDTEAADQLSQRLNQLPGVAEAVVVAEEGMAYLKVDTHLLDVNALQEFSSDKD